VRRGCAFIWRPHLSAVSFVKEQAASVVTLSNNAYEAAEKRDYEA
jgi:hypothetical protein